VGVGRIHKPKWQRGTNVEAFQGWRGVTEFQEAMLAPQRKGIEARVGMYTGSRRTLGGGRLDSKKKKPQRHGPGRTRPTRVKRNLKGGGTRGRDKTRGRKTMTLQGNVVEQDKTVHREEMNKHWEKPVNGGLNNRENSGEDKRPL